MSSCATFYNGFRRDAHPMAVMCGVVGALSAFYHDSLDINNPEQPPHQRLPPDRQGADHRRLGLQIFDRPAVHVSAQRPRLRGELPAHDERRSGRGISSQPGAGEGDGPIMILHADHEQNASTSTVRLAGSTGANPFACIAAGIASLWGPAHGGANEAVLKMLAEIGMSSNIPDFLAKVKDKNSNHAPDGLRPPRLQELRPAREDHAEAPATTCCRSSASRTIRCWTWRWSWRKSR
jgi:citrate synthase